MTLKELYDAMGGDYEQAIKVLRIEKLIDKHIRKLPDNPIFGNLSEAGRTMDGKALFESSHAVKGVCANLGLVKMSACASDVAEQFRPGNSRTLSDGQVQEKVNEIGAMYEKCVEEINKYAQSLQ
ncbi:MAG: Hpt domain-containing protein [Clostridia bacterium]|nr:Hpt domain-containing protein [Clostridia bacterium]